LKRGLLVVAVSDTQGDAGANGNTDDGSASGKKRLSSSDASGWGRAIR
jgi:hypothetical protein